VGAAAPSGPKPANHCLVWQHHIRKYSSACTTSDDHSVGIAGAISRPSEFDHDVHCSASRPHRPVEPANSACLYSDTRVPRAQSSSEVLDRCMNPTNSCIRHGARPPPRFGFQMCAQSVRRAMHDHPRSMAFPRSQSQTPSRPARQYLRESHTAVRGCA
jgi:hypothetical protein